MSHWMTSGRSRLQAKQNRSFAQRAQQRANVMAPEAMMQSYATGASGQDHPRKRRRSEGSSLKYSYANPIHRRGKVVQIGRASNHPPSPQSGVMVREPLSDLNHHGYRRRIRDPSMKLHSTRNTIPLNHIQPAQPQFAGHMQPSQHVEAPQPPFACRTRTDEELWHDQHHHQPDSFPAGIRKPSSRFDSQSLGGHPGDMYTEGGGGSYELHHREQGPRRRPEQGVSRFRKPSQQAESSSNYDDYDADYQCDISGRFSTSMQRSHPVDAYSLDSDLIGIPQRGAPLEDFDIEPQARQLFRSQSETHSWHSRHSFPEHHSGISVSSRTNNVGQIFSIPDRRQPKMDGSFSQAAHAMRFRDPMDPPNHTYQEDDGIYAQAPDMPRQPSDFQDNFPTNYVTAKPPTTGVVPYFSNRPRKEFGAMDFTRSQFEPPDQPMRQIADHDHPRAADQNRQRGISRFQKTSVSQENPPPVAEHHHNFDPFGAHEDESYRHQDQQVIGVEPQLPEYSTSRRDLPTFGPRLFNNGVEVDITGRPLSRPNSPAVSSQLQNVSTHVESQMAAGRPKEEKDPDLDFFEGIDLDDGKSIWNCFETQGTDSKIK